MRRGCTHTFCEDPASVSMPDGRDDCRVPIELAAVLLGLEELAVSGWVVVLQVRFNGLVLLVKLREVGHEVLHDVHCIAEIHVQRDPETLLY